MTLPKVTWDFHQPHFEYFSNNFCGSVAGGMGFWHLMSLGKRRYERGSWPRYERSDLTSSASDRSGAPGRSVASRGSRRGDAGHEGLGTDGEARSYSSFLFLVVVASNILQPNSFLFLWGESPVRFHGTHQIKACHSELESRPDRVPCSFGGYYWIPIPLHHSRPISFLILDILVDCHSLAESIRSLSSEFCSFVRTRPSSFICCKRN